MLAALAAVKSPLWRSGPITSFYAASQPCKRFISTPVARHALVTAAPLTRSPLAALSQAGLTRLLLGNTLGSYSGSALFPTSVGAASAPSFAWRSSAAASHSRRAFTSSARAAAEVPSGKEPTPAAETAPAFFGSPIKWWRWQATKMKSMFKEYGLFAVAVYLGVYVITLGSLYIIVKLDLISRPDVNGWINNWRVTKIFTDKPVSVPPDFIDFATAWVLTKTTEPVRLAVVLAILPVLVRKVPPHVIAKFKRKPKAPQ